MLFFDLTGIGNNMFIYRKKIGLTQAEVAEKAGISDRTYADIERGSVNMRIDTFLRICQVLNAAPNELLVRPVEKKELTPEDIRRILEEFDRKKEMLTELSELINELTN